MPGWYVSAPCRSFPASDPSPSLQATSTKTTTTTHLLHPLTVIFLSQFRSSRQHCHFFVLLFLLSSHTFALFINEQKASNKVAISELQGTAYFRSPDLNHILKKFCRPKMASLATSAAAVRDIAKTSLGRDNFTAVAAARSVPVTRSHPLPTPPNSISPALPPHGLKAQLQKASRLEPIDSDLDLHDGTDSESVGSGSFESTGAISPALLAKYHLPEILLNHGPMPIRYIMGYLTTSVPGFAGIPPPKARRLVVAALEGRGQGHGAEGGGVNGDVIFEKIGWGRWDAKRRGHPNRDASSRRSPEAAAPYPAGIPIIKGPRAFDRTRLGARPSSFGNSAAFSHDDRDVSMLENEADKMSLDSLDEPASASCSEAGDDDMIMNDDPEDATDDEDWAAVGAAALRAESYSSPAEARHGFSHVYNGGNFRSFSGAGMLREPRLDNIDLAALAASPNTQEREAIQALLQLGSV